ncbi:hypothetical protein EVAR_87006_1 [Eumeta japonica]|uniref:Uncharacterized protein n=1 Tax=Eumeta variegata TaxID=151549 RepID=A0A4C1W8D0_EUMVA|nr:hypothetical protein EVAR_87006_1 [Eumeta japonica]
MRRAQARQSHIFRYVVILLRVYWRKVTRARRTASADWWITPGTAGMRPRDLFTTSRDYRESVGTRGALGRPRSRGCRPRSPQSRSLCSSAPPHQTTYLYVLWYVNCRKPDQQLPITEV